MLRHGVARSVNPPLLEEIGTVVIPAASEPFVAREKFVKGNAGISGLGYQFRAWFLGKTEEPAAETTLRYAKLVKASVDGPIREELGDKAETTLAQVYALMELQKNGGEGAVLTNRWANIFYVGSRVVRVVWDGGGWHVGAYSVARRPPGWHGESQVFSRNS